ncbi:hypothetical protein I545_1515 [Mycobacterium kansasii 662]|uniref:Uncharacterized protein n=3 Tax=Mycobacterium kansasii TaxID=1768 RepID=A0A1V3WGJ6_MYCKA|nr:hypothetical protein I545_1515 [Mycobacterium kansasii 662]KEP42468.1 hypothetical protein MKSMC1_23980 [Mycobacterium kansasii]OOK66089.1 hypothetical protein BZL29_7445 [Mycobacterium kansasii]
MVSPAPRDQHIDTEQCCHTSFSRARATSSAVMVGASGDIEYRESIDHNDPPPAAATYAPAQK